MLDFGRYFFSCGASVRDTNVKTATFAGLIVLTVFGNWRIFQAVCSSNQTDKTTDFSDNEGTAMSLDGLSLRDTIVTVVGSAGLLWYYISLITVGRKPLAPSETSTNFREFMSFSITNIGVKLATFVGMLLPSGIIFCVLEVEFKDQSNRVSHWRSDSND